MHYLKIISLLLNLLNIKYTSSRCMFPEFLWRPPDASGALSSAAPKDKQRVWLTKIEFFDRTTIWDSLLEITAGPESMTAKTIARASCNDYAGTVPCFKKNFLWKRTCMEDQRHLYPDTYAVRHEGNGHQLFTCIHIIKRDELIIQVRTGLESEDIHDDLCNPDVMNRNPWPWIDAVQKSWHPCPIQGGFDFDAYLFNRRKKVCNRRVWRSSRLESECVEGDGVSFIFPERSCSPFEDHAQELSIQCVGSWQEENYIFLIARQGNHTPHFTVRFPLNYSTQLEFSAYLYFSPIATLDPAGLVSGGVRQANDIRFVRLDMRRSEPGTCYDESHLCVQYAENGLCMNMGEYGNYCKRSCGLCELTPSRRSECRFPNSYHGEYHLFSKTYHTTIQIHAGLVDLGDMGELICKAKHWELNQYKLMSYYSNGCRPRYTCINFGKSNGVSLEYRISKSYRNDRSFDICEFEDDPPPLKNKIRSEEMKTLISGSAISNSHTCGLHGSIRLNATVVGGPSCEATLSDWIEDTCSLDDRLTLTLYNCHNSMKSTHEYICMTYMAVHDDVSFLVTQHSVYPDRYNCWLIYTYPQLMSYRPWRNIYVLPQQECAQWINSDAVTPKRADIILKSYNDKVSQPCRQSDVPSSSRSGSQYNRKDVSSQLKKSKDKNQPLYLGSYVKDTGSSLTYYLSIYMCLFVSCTLYVF